MALYGRAFIPILGRILPQTGERVPQRSQDVDLLDDTSRAVGTATLAMFFVATTQSERTVITTSLQSRDMNGTTAPPISTETGTLLTVLRSIDTRAHGDQLQVLSQCLCIFELIWPYCSKLRFQNADGTVIPLAQVRELGATQGSVMDDLVSQATSNLKFIRDVVMPYVKDKSHQITRVLQDHVRALLKCIFEVSVILFSWVDTYARATYNFFEHSLDTLVQHAFYAMRQTMSVSGLCRYSILCEIRPEILSWSSEKDTEIRLCEGALYEIIHGYPRQCGDALYSLRDLKAKNAMEWIQLKLSNHSRDNRPTNRDALRRMLTHLAQESDVLPPSLLLSVTMYGGPHIDGGSFGTIHCGQMYQENKVKVVAMKAMTVYPRTGDTVQRLRQMYLEVLSCQSLSCSNVVKILGIYQARDEVYIVMDYFPRGNTINYRTQVLGFQNYRNGRLLDLVHKWIVELSIGLSYLHEEGIVHGDIRGVNLLVDDRESLLIADFGLSVFANGESKQYLSKRTGNMEWMAPEILDRGEGMSLRPTKMSDSYSFSHVCIELYTGKPPYQHIAEDIRRTDLRNVVVRNGKRPPLPTLYGLNSSRTMDPNLYRLLQRCWVDNPAERLGMDVVKRQLQEYHFDKIYSELYG
ncbi:kinase-like domain-containing protein [Irpex rosettiformis]|uniref:Kinase-like domain-containing protein n=1 Tax=Irpex rosettiformis TaxID=378272 RepID=A0ACB8U317_9APHY|nr:kinase-like domain-containing protein [Irpex rosettiformis]